MFCARGGRGVDTPSEAPVEAGKKVRKQNVPAPSDRRSIKLRENRSMAEKTNVLVVGGGPAGLAAAEAAAKQGVETIVLERQNEIGYPIHTSGGSWVQDMRTIGIPEHLYHPIRTAFFLSPQREVKIAYDQAAACVIDVRGVYQHLAGKAVRAGAQVRVRHTVEQALTEEGSIVGVRVKDHRSERAEIRADITIDASGMGRHLGIRQEMGDAVQRYGFGAEYDLYAPNYPQDELYLIVGSIYAPQGYAWVFPRGEGRVRVGVGVIHPDSDLDARHYLDVIMNDIPSLREKFAGSSPLEYHTGLFPSESSISQFSRNGFLLAGDAGVQGSTLVGEGIRFAIYSGQMAGNVAAEAVKAGDSSVEYLKKFDRQWRARYGREMDISLMINKHIVNFEDRQWDGALDMLKKMSPSQVAQVLRGDYSLSLILGIIARNPLVVAKGGKRFLDLVLDRLRKGEPVPTA